MGNTLDEVVLRYVAERRARHEENACTGKNTTSTLMGFSAVFGKRPLERLSSRDVERWLESRSYLRPSTRRNQFSKIRCFCKWLRRRGLLNRDIFDELDSPKAPRALPRALGHGDMAATLSVCPDARARAIIWLMNGCGLRCIEVHRLEVADWDRRAAGVIARGKGSAERWVPIAGAPARALDAYLDEHPATAGPLVRSYNNPWAPLTAAALSRLVSGWMSDAGVKKAPWDGRSAHAWRHTAATELLDDCGDLRVVQEFLGHAHLSTTSIYLARAGLPKLVAAQRARLARYDAADDPAA